MRVTFQRILCATDLSDASHQAIAHGITLAREFEADTIGPEGPEQIPFRIHRDLAP